ncbi:hypothetical protein NNO07_27020, partial [Pseudomonas resinovorans]
VVSVTTADAPSGIGGGTNPPGIVVDPSAPQSVTIKLADGGALTGRPQVGQTLVAETTCLETCGTLTYQWKVESSAGSGNFENIPGATSERYTPLASQQRRELQVGVVVAQ